MATLNAVGHGGPVTVGDTVARSKKEKGEVPTHLIDFASMEAHSGVVKLKPDLARKLQMMVTAGGGKASIADLLDPIVRPAVEAMWADFKAGIARIE